MQADVVVDLPDVRRRDLDRRPSLSILVVAIGNHGVQAVVAAVELDDDQDAALRAAACLSSASAAAERARNERDRLPAGEQGGRAEAEADHFAASGVHGVLLVQAS